MKYRKILEGQIGFRGFRQLKGRHIVTPIEQARLRMPPALPMSLAPRDGTPVLVCGVVISPGVVPGQSNIKTWEKAYYYEGSYFSLAGYRIHNPLGWLPLPEVLTTPVSEMPAPPTPERHKPLPYPEDDA